MTYIRASVGHLLFDAVFRTDHGLRSRATGHPVQSGADVSDHVILENASLVMQIGMTDVGTLLTPGREGRSVEMFGELNRLFESRRPFEVTTRLKTYGSMIIESISVSDDHTTAGALKATISMREVRVADVAYVDVKLSAQPHKTDATNRGTLEPTNSVR